MTRAILLLRLEGLAVLASASTAYALTEASWILFVVLLLAPDLFMLGYLFGRRFGASFYNLGHNYVVPLLAVGAGYFLEIPLLVSVGLIWTAHIGLDRMLGFGLKLTRGFGHTHLHAVDDDSRGIA